MKQYTDLIKTILDTGYDRIDRTHTGTIGIFGHAMRFDLQDGFPLVTVKKTWFHGVAAELIWMLRGSTNVNDLPEDVQKLWRPWATERGSLGPTYGESYRKFRDPEEKNSIPLDQLTELIRRLKDEPYSRRHVMTLWNPLAIDMCELPPCHGTVIQFYVQNELLSCATYQRSADVFLGLPFNIASYALLTHLVAATCGYGVGELVYSLGDAHLYVNHLPQAKELLGRRPFPLPQLEVKLGCDVFNATEEGLVLTGYNSWPALGGVVSV